VGTALLWFWMPFITIPIDLALFGWRAVEEKV